MERLRTIPANRRADLLIFLVLALFPLAGSAFYTQLLTKYMVFLILAWPLALLWGYAGLMNLGHAVLFGLGGYAMALCLSAQQGVPDFMARGGVTQMPFWLKILANPAAAVLAGILIPARLASLRGIFLCRRRVGGVWFAVITLALAQVFNLFIQSQSVWTGGFNGIGGLPGLSLFGAPLGLGQSYYFIFLIAVLVYAFCVALTRSRFGMILRGIRENETRLEFLGYKKASFKAAAFAVSGALAGLAGVLYVPVNGMIAPNDVGMEGGLAGAAVGAVLVNVLGSARAEQFGAFWQLLLGAVMIVTVLFMPRGIVGTLIHRSEGREMRREAQERE